MNLEDVQQILATPFQLGVETLATFERRRSRDRAIMGLRGAPYNDQAVIRAIHGPPSTPHPRPPERFEKFQLRFFFSFFTIIYESTIFEYESIKSQSFETESTINGKSRTNHQNEHKKQIHCKIGNKR